MEVVFDVVEVVFEEELDAPTALAPIPTLSTSAD